jgi:pimeloyl-ACP methyl ester carboxylesterase
MSARVVGHDIGLMVAYAYAAQYPNEVESLTLMDAFLPGIGAWRDIYDDPNPLAVIALKSELLAHLADEERLLEPILAVIDAWGSIRAALLGAEHAHQRAVLAVLTGPVAWPAATLVAARTLSLCEDLLTDMEFEERELLSEKLLRDDLILLDASDA